MDKIAIGTGVFYSAGSDRYPGTIQKVSADGKTFWFTNDHCVNKAVYPDQDWEMTPRICDVESEMTCVKMVTRGNKKGSWTVGGKAGGTQIHVGVKRKYYDPHF